MRILRLGNSADVISSVPEEGRALRLVEGMLAERLGVPVETVFRRIDARPAMAALAARWAAEHRPDVALLIVNQFWYAYPSAPTRLVRFGAPGRWAARMAYRATRQQWLVESRAFVLVRRLARRTMGAAYLWEPEDVAARVTETLERLRSEHPGLPLALWSEPDSVVDGGDRTLAREINARRRAVHAPLREVCAHLGVAAFLEDEPPATFDWPRFRDVDGMHLNAAGHRWVAESQVAVLMDALGTGPEGAFVPGNEN